MPKIKDTQGQWLQKQLQKYGQQKVQNKFNQFHKKFPNSNLSSFKVLIRQQAECLKVVDNPQEEVNKNLRKSILYTYSMEAKRTKKTPLIKDLDIKQADIQKLFGGKEEMDAAARYAYPLRFKGIIDHTVWSHERLTELKGTIKKSNSFVITTAVGGCPVDDKFLASLKLYCRHNKATLLILMADQSLDELSTSLIEENIVYADVKLNSNLFISTIKILPKMIEPMTGLDRIGGKRGSFIFGSPKQRLKYVPVSKKTKSPHVLMTTGAVTLPKYIGAKYYQKRTDYLAEQDHKMGAIIVQIEDEKLFHFRQVQMDNSGGFVDLGKYYCVDSVKREPAKALVMGDLHSGDTDTKVMECWANLAKETHADTLIIHDGFNGHSINHHERNDGIARAKTYLSNRGGLMRELVNYAAALGELTKVYKKVIITHGNHDDFVYKYLRDGWYCDDPDNHLIALDLAKQLILGNNPIAWYVNQVVDRSDRIEWLEIDDDVYVEGIKISDHGHLGPNGSRGNLKALEKTVAKAVYGHSHTPQILREVYQVGTSTKLNLEYAKGPSSWFNASCIIYKGGHRQMINAVDGKYKP